MNDDVTPEISDWAEHLALTLVEARIRDQPMHEQAAMVFAATAERAIGYQVLITLSRTVALVLRPDGHPGGPIGLTEASRVDPAYERATQLLGFAAQDDADMVDALARAVIAAPDPLAEARTTLWAILEVLTTEPMTPTTKDTPS